MIIQTWSRRSCRSNTEYARSTTPNATFGSQLARFARPEDPGLLLDHNVLAYEQWLSKAVS